MSALGVDVLGLPILFSGVNRNLAKYFYSDEGGSSNSDFRR